MDCSPPGSPVRWISRQEYWSGLPFPSPGGLPNPGIEPDSAALAGGFFTTEPAGKPHKRDRHIRMYSPTVGFPGGSEGQESACNAGDLDSTPRLGRSLEEGNGKPLQYSCLQNPMDRGAWQAIVHVVAKRLWTRLSN